MVYIIYIVKGCGAHPQQICSGNAYCQIWGRDKQIWCLTVFFLLYHTRSIPKRRNMHICLMLDRNYILHAYVLFLCIRLLWHSLPNCHFTVSNAWLENRYHMFEDTFWLGVQSLFTSYLLNRWTTLRHVTSIFFLINRTACVKILNSTTIILSMQKVLF